MLCVASGKTNMLHASRQIERDTYSRAKQTKRGRRAERDRQSEASRARHGTLTSPSGVLGLMHDHRSTLRFSAIFSRSRLRFISRAVGLDAGIVKPCGLERSARAVGAGQRTCWLLKPGSSRGDDSVKLMYLHSSACTRLG
jgi:hypothetical protein